MLILRLYFAIVIISNSLNSLEVVSLHFLLFLHSLFESVPASQVLLFFEYLHYSLFLCHLKLLFSNVLVFLNPVCFEGSNFIGPLHGLIQLARVYCESVWIHGVSLQLWLIDTSIHWKSSWRYDWVSKTRLLVFKKMLSNPFFWLGEMKRPWFFRVSLVLSFSFKDIRTIVIITRSFEIRSRNLTDLHFAGLVSIGTCGLHWLVNHTTVRLKKVGQRSINYRSKRTSLQTWQLLYHAIEVFPAFCSRAVYCDCVRMSGRF